MAARITARLPEDLVQRAKRKATAQGRTLTALIEEGLRRVLNDRESVSNLDRVLPLVSSASGGVLPGVNLSDSVALQDLERV